MLKSIGKSLTVTQRKVFVTSVLSLRKLEQMAVSERLILFLKNRNTVTLILSKSPQIRI